jgi:glycosyltransferase involved in cell wall biosynthesis
MKDQELNVLQIIKGLDIGAHNGGAENFGVALSRELCAGGACVSVCAYYQYDTPVEAALRERLENEGIKVFYANQFFHASFVQSLLTINRFIKVNKINGIHSHVQVGSIIGCILKLLHRIRLFRTAHTPVEFGASFVGNLSRFIFVQLVYPLLVDIEIGVSDSIVKSLDRRWLARLFNKKSKRIYNAISITNENNERRDPFEAYRSDPRQTYFIITAAAILNRFKNFDTIIRAMSLILEKIPHARFAIVGTGPMEAEYHKLAEDLGISGAVWFLGQRNDVSRILQCSNVFVQPSTVEGLSTVILEAMQQGVAVVATEISGNRELIQDGENGLLFPVGNEQQLAIKILDLFHNPAQASQYAARAKSQLKKFDIKMIAEEYQHLYHTMRV